jgi:hydroxymethylbilane synthase
MSSSETLRLGTRGSLLARSQSQMIADELMRLHAGLQVELIIIKTSGDQVQDKPLADIGGKGLFTKELEQALLANEVDFAVHSFKDVPVTMPLVDQAGLMIAAVPQREVPLDAMISLKAKSIDALPQRAKVGTGSLRRRAQIVERRPDLLIENIRGNVDTRIRKLKSGEFDAVILAVAGLKRSNLFDPSFMTPLHELVPAAAQGALAIQCRKDDARTRRFLEPLDDSASHLAVDCERAIVQALNGDCHSPIAAIATIENGELTLRAAVAGRDGVPPILRAESSTSVRQANECVKRVTDDLMRLGAQKILQGPS